MSSINNSITLSTMTNIEKYNKVFKEILQISSNDLKTAKFKNSELWDSVGHMTLVASLEDTFDIVLETDDLMGITSYDKCIEILSHNYGIEF